MAWKGLVMMDGGGLAKHILGLRDLVVLDVEDGQTRSW